MLVVGVEVSNIVVTALRAGSAQPAFHGATAVVVESDAQVSRRGGPDRARIAGYARRGGVAESFAALRTADPVGLWLVPEGERTRSVPAGAVEDLTARHGRASGALGVLQCAAAVGWFAAGNTATVLATAGGPDADATAATLLRAGGDAR
jgi:3-oxoacyl-[acyl-carrier-protein] synthase II